MLKYLLRTLLVASIFASQCSSTEFINGFSIGPDVGYNFIESYTGYKNKADMMDRLGFRRFQANHYFAGLHGDFNCLMTDSIFIGFGIGVNYSPSSKEYDSGSHYWVDDTTTEADGSSFRSARYANKNSILFHKKNSQYFTVRAGTLLRNDLTLDINVSVINSSFKIKGAIFTYNKVLNSHDLVLNYSSIEDNIESNKNFQRIGFAPGIGLTLFINKNFSIGINYRCEIYAKNKSGSKPQMISNTVFTKLSYHI